MERIESNGLLFDTRPNTSDAQAIKEVVTKHGYTRKYFQIEAGEQWLDLGANIGAFSVFASSKGASVRAYEPEPQNALLAKNNVTLNGFDVQVIEQAVVADTFEQKQLNLYLSNTSYGLWRHSLYKTKNKHAIPVEAVKISSILEGVDGIKMDIEGAEIDILSTIVGFGSVRKLVFEYHFDINNSIPLFLQLTERLCQFFQHVQYGKMPLALEYNFFPPARIVFCWND